MSEEEIKQMIETIISEKSISTNEPNWSRL